MGNIFLEITVVLCVASILSIICKVLKQPAILAYILTGVIMGPLGLFHIQNQDFFRALGDLGITFLLFILGLEIRIREFPLVGKTAFMLSIFQIIATFLLGFGLSVFLNFSLVSSLYIAIALSLSSTIIVVKLISDKKDVHSLYGKLSVGVLIVQNFLAIGVLILLSSFNTQTALATPLGVLAVVFKGIFLLGFLWYLSIRIFPKIVETLSRSSEILFLVSIAWVFLLSLVVSSPFFGFSIEIGGFLAGLTLSNSFANYQIIAKVKILRDFFIVLFFVLLGLKMNFQDISSALMPALILSLFVLLIKPFIVMLTLRHMGFRKRTAFLAGISLGQISEFSPIIIFFGQRLGHIPANLLSIMTLIGLITFTLSTYKILNANWLYLKLSPYLNFLQKSNTPSEQQIHSDKKWVDFKNHVVLIGADQMGESIIEALGDMGKEVVVVDFDPAIVKKLKSKNVHRLFGDISDSEIKDLARLHKASLVISTIPDVEDNLLLIRELKHKKSPATVIVTALDNADAKTLYSEGADYVVLPHLAGGRQLAKILEKDLSQLASLKAKDQQYL